MAVKSLEPGRAFDFTRPCRLTIEHVVYASPETGRTLYKVHNDQDGLSYALKCIPVAGAADFEAVRRETVALNRQNQHPDRLPRFRGAVVRDGLAHLLLDWMDGTPLDRITRGAPASSQPDFSLRLAFATQACDTVALLHKNGFKHRDVKPANLVARSPDRPDRGVAVVDLGLSNQPRSAEEGTLGFQAPEQFGMRNQNLTPAADVFALAQVAWYLLTGAPRLLVQAEGADAWHDVGASLAERLTGTQVPAALDIELRKAVEFRQERRHANAGALAAALRAAERGRSR